MPFRPVVSSKFTQDKIELVARLDENAKLSDRNTETLLPMPKLTFKKVLYRIGKEEETLPIKKPTVITQRGESKKLILKRLKAFYFRLLLPSFLFKEQNGSCNVSEKEVVLAYKEPLRQTSLQFPTYCL